MASPWLQGMQFGFDSSLRMQELKSQQAIRRIHEENAAKALSLKIQENELAIQERADTMKAVAAMEAATAPKITVPMMGQEDLGDMAPPVMTVDNPNPMTQEQAAMRFLLPVVGKYRGSDAARNFLEGVALAEYRKRAEENFTPSAGEVTLPGGKNIPFVKTSPRSAQLVIDPTVENIQDPTTGRNVSVLRTGTSGARVIPENIGNRQVSAWALKNAPELMEMREDGTAFLPPQNFNEAARRAGIPAGVKSDMMTQIATTAGAFEVGRKLLPLLTPENVGVRGFIGRKLEEQGLAQLFPGMKIGSATETLSVASNFRAGLVRALRSDSNINKDEREQIIEGLPTPENMLSSVQDSKVKLATQLELAAIKSRAAANTLGKPITPFYLRIDEIEQMIAAGTLTAEEAARAWNANAWNLIEQIRADVQR